MSPPPADRRAEVLRGEVGVPHRHGQRGVAEKLLQLLERWLPPFRTLLGYAYARTGRPRHGMALLQEAAGQAEVTVRCQRGGYASFESDVLLLVDDWASAQSAAERGLGIARGSHERGDAARCLLTLGKAETEGPGPRRGPRHVPS